MASIPAITLHAAAPLVLVLSRLAGAETQHHHHWLPWPSLHPLAAGEVVSGVRVVMSFLGLPHGTVRGCRVLILGTEISVQVGHWLCVLWVSLVDGWKCSFGA